MFMSLSLKVIFKTLNIIDIRDLTFKVDICIDDKRIYVRFSSCIKNILSKYLIFWNRNFP